MATISITITAILSIILGILILAFPKVLRIALGLYFLVVGIVALLGL